MSTIRILEFIVFNLLLPVSLICTILQRGPMGISLCEQICDSTVDCEIFTFSPNHLACFNGNLTDSLENNVVIGPLKKPKQQLNPNCRPGSRVLNSRRNRRICMQWKSTQENVTESNDFIPSNQLHKLRVKGFQKLKKDSAIYLHKHYKDRRSWDNATAQCTEDGGLLMQLQEEFKWDLLHEILNLPSFYGYAWIGLSDQQRNDQYVWADGSGMKDKTRWFTSYFSSEPSHKRLEDENCAMIGYMGIKVRELKLYDRPCSQRYGFICEVVSKHN